MNKWPAFLFCFFTISAAAAQDTLRLHEYLQRHRYTIDFTSDHAFSMLPQLMNGKNVLVLGEGGNHELSMYATLKPALVNQLAKQNLKYFLIESGRTTAFFMNNYLHDGYNDCPKYMERFCDLCNRMKPATQAGSTFKVVGIDFEFTWDFHESMQYLLGNVALDKCPHARALITELLDTGYMAFSYADFYKFGKFYREKQEQLYADSSAIRTELGDKYADLLYFLSNPNVTRPNKDRNGALAQNLLAEIMPLDTSAVYFLSTGIAHSLPCESYSAIHKALKNEELRSRTIVMNVHCEQCAVQGKAMTGRSPMKFLNEEDIKACLSNAANAEIVLFDLSALPPEYDNIKKYGDLLLFARNQR